MTGKYPLQPKDWKSGTHADCFAQWGHHFAGRSVLDVGAGSGVDRPDRMLTLVASVASEVVWVGEVIEHLDSARNHLRDGGLLVLTTPIVFAISSFVDRSADDFGSTRIIRVGARK